MKQDTGLYKKFNVSRVDGRDAEDGDRVGAEYFVIDMTHDPLAITAILAYADACEAQEPKLAAELRARFGK